MKLYFPHEEVRPSQKEMMDKIVEVLEQGKNLLVHAPTGSGKTATALTSAVSFALQADKKYFVFFITPKHTQHKIAIDTLRLMKEKHKLNFEVLDIIGKKWLCAQPGVSEMSSKDFGEYCGKMIKEGGCTYYHNLWKNNNVTVEGAQALRTLQGTTLHAEELKEHASNKHLCPFEIATLHGQKAKVIIADYNHLLSPTVRDHFFKKINADLSQSIIIIDEAHNLPDKSREVSSAELNTLLLEAAIKEAGAAGYKDMGDDIFALKELLEKLAREKTAINMYEAKIKKEELIEHLSQTIDYEEFMGNMNFIADQIRDQKQSSWCGSIASFLLQWMGPDEAFTRILTKGFTERGKPFISISYNCLDPAVLLKPLSEEAHSIIAMSGTLTPTQLYKDLVGYEAETVVYPSPFPKHNKMNIIIPDTTTKFTLRDQSMYQKIAHYCAQVVNAIPGNTAIFFPSYQLRDEVYKHFQPLCEKTCFQEMQRMSKLEKGDMIENFKKYAKVGAVLLGASSGNFGEGLDIKDNILKCVIVVGLPLAKPDLATQELINYYDRKFGKGWDYGYTMPALIKCFQNAGRAIRSSTDKGVIIYLDERFTWGTYFQAFPKDEDVQITKDAVGKIREFFKQS